MSTCTRAVALLAAATASLVIAALTAVQLREPDSSKRTAAAVGNGAEFEADLVRLRGAEEVREEEGTGPAVAAVAAVASRTEPVEASAGGYHALSEAAQKLLSRVEGRKQRFEGAARSAGQPDERSPADAELIADLERSQAEDSLDELLLESQLSEAQGSLQMLRALNRSLADR
jgi:hypothetical protein